MTGSAQRDALQEKKIAIDLFRTLFKIVAEVKQD